MPNSGSDLGIYALCTEVGGGTLGTTGGYTYGKDIGSPLTKNKSTFSDYHDPRYNGPDTELLVSGNSEYNEFRWCGLFQVHNLRPEYLWEHLGSRLSKN